MKIIKTQKNKGFTLIEIMVAMSIFMIVMLMAIGAFFVVSNSAKKAKALRVAMDNVSFAMENMSRSLRLGSNYSYPSVGNNAIMFTPYNLGPNENETFQLSSLIGDTKTVQKVSSSAGVVDLTSPEINITDLRFIIEGESTSDEKQPSVFIMMKGEVRVNREVTNFAIQTLASQRNAE